MAGNFELSFGSNNTGFFPFVTNIPDDLQAFIDAKYPLVSTVDVLPKWLAADSMPNQGRLGVPPPAPLPPVALNELYVPPHLHEFSIFRGLASRADVTGMLAGSVNATGSLIMRSGPAVNGPIGIWGYVTFGMTMLPPRPLAGRDDVADLFLVTLVSTAYWNRFTFQSSAYTTQTLDEVGGVAWSGFVGGATVAAAYQTIDPESELFGQVNRRDVFQEAIAANVGRVTGSQFLFDGTLGAYESYPRWATVNAYLLAARAKWKSYRIAGGMVAADPAVADAFRAPYMPKYFVATFPEWITELGWLQRHVTVGPTAQTLYPRVWNASSYSSLYTKLLNAATDLGSPYSNWLYRDHFAQGEAVVLQTTMKAAYGTNDPNTSAPDNQTDLDALAVQLVKDYLDANSVMFDETYQGLVPFPLFGSVYAIWKYGPEPTTRVWRHPPLGTQTTFQHGGPDRTVLPPVAFVKINGAAAAGDRFPGLVNGDISLDVFVDDKQAPGTGAGLQNGKYYKGILTGVRSWGAAYGVKAVYEVRDPDTVLDAAGSTTLVSGGTANAILYTNGSTLESGDNVLVSGPNGTLRQEVTGGEWWGMDVGTN